MGERNKVIFLVDLSQREPFKSQTARSIASLYKCLRSLYPPRPIYRITPDSKPPLLQLPFTSHLPEGAYVSHLVIFAEGASGPCPNLSDASWLPAEIATPRRFCPLTFLARPIISSYVVTTLRRNNEIPVKAFRELRGRFLAGARVSMEVEHFMGIDPLAAMRRAEALAYVLGLEDGTIYGLSDHLILPHAPAHFWPSRKNSWPNQTEFQHYATHLARAGINRFARSVCRNQGYGIAISNFRTQTIVRKRYEEAYYALTTATPLVDSCVDMVKKEIRP